eukprot:15366315-Ditylum_brightwellii.AAC.1
MDVKICDGRYCHKRAVLRSSKLGRKDLNDPDLLTIDSCGFELCKLPEVRQCSMSNSDFYEPTGRIVRENYYPLVADFLKRYTGASYVKVVRHSIRNGQIMDRRNYQMKESKKIDGLCGYSSDVHTDYTQETADTSFRKMANFPETRHYRTGRYIVFCVWKPLGDKPIRNDHLALLDERTINRTDDCVEVDVYGHNFQTVVHRLDSSHAAQHRWYYFPDMKADEVCVFKHFDSDPNQVSRGVFHTSFVDPTAPEGTLNKRQSIDVRAFCYFPDHTPNTCPIVPPLSTEEECQRNLATNLLLLVARNFHHQGFQWPGEKIDWVVEQVVNHGIEGVKAVAKDIVTDEMNYFELRDRSEEAKERIITMLLENDNFGKALKASVEKVRVRHLHFKTPEE